MAGTKRNRGGDSWRLEVCVGTDVKGKPLRFSKTVHCKSERAADRELSKFYAECAAGKVQRQSAEMLAPFCDTYYTEYAERFLKRSSQSGAKTAIDIWIKPMLGQKKIAKLSRMDIQLWINDMSDKGVSPKTIRNYYSTLRQILSYAVDMGVLNESPCKSIKLPKKTKAEVKYYGIDDVKKLLACVDRLDGSELTYKTAILILLFGGLRKAEVLGLNWEDVNFMESTIYVHRTRMIARGGVVYEDTPKTASSVRYVNLPNEVMATLADLKAYQEDLKEIMMNKYEDSPAVLRGQCGRPLHPQTFQHWFTRFIERSGLPNIGLHGLRHTHASMLAHMNTDKVQISERLGHSELSTTLNIYTHLFEDADKKVAEDLSAKYFGEK